MKQKIIKDNVVRNVFKKKELKCLGLKILTRNKILNYIEVCNEYNKINKNVSITKIQNRCIFTARSRSVSKLTKISRIKLREFVKIGALTGFKKLNW